MKRNIVIIFTLFLIISCGGGGGDQPSHPGSQPNSTTGQSSIQFDINLSGTSTAIATFVVNIQDVFWDVYTNATKLTAIQEKDIKIDNGQKYLLELNGQTINSLWIANGSGANITLLNNATFVFTVGGKQYSLNISALNWRNNGQGGGNLAIYFTFNGSQIVWERYTESNPAPNTQRLLNINLNLGSTPKAFRTFSVNVNGVFWQQYTDASRITTIETSDITIYTNEEYLLEVNGQTADGDWLADWSGIHSSLLNNATLKFEINGVQYNLNLSSLVWRDNGQGGGNAAILFTFDGTNVIWGGN